MSLWLQDDEAMPDSDRDSRVDVEDADFSITSLLKCSETASLRLVIQKTANTTGRCPAPYKGRCTLDPRWGTCKQTQSDFSVHKRGSPECVQTHALHTSGHELENAQ